MSLYPLKFKPIFKERIWGGDRLKTVLGKNSKIKNCGESWEISAIAQNVSVVNNGTFAGSNLQELIEIYFGDLVGEKVYQKFGVEFPLLVKFIDAEEVLSIQVHPDDELAKTRHKAFGKNEMWYIVESENDAEIIFGFNQKINKQTYLNLINQPNNLQFRETLNCEFVKKEDVFFIPAGMVHAIGSGILLAEIQQTSDITYRIYDWDRKDAEGNSRELHTDLAADAINFSFWGKGKTEYRAELNKSAEIANCQYFTANVLHFDKAIAKDYFKFDSFVIYMCLEGEFSIHYNKDEKPVEVTKGETVLVPAIFTDIELHPKKETKILEIFIGNE